MDLSPLPPADLSAEYRPRARQLADAVVQALSTPSLSLDAIRGAAERYGRAARDLALALDDMLAALTPRVRGSLDAVPASQRAEILAQVQWWAIHGYYRGD
jgi:hypothetical protein